ncbi:MAG: hypothetical protein MRJ92_13060 [Nitrospira sp.]|nr:hypothetical protein [Nitrospira sp.]
MPANMPFVCLSTADLQSVHDTDSMLPEFVGVAMVAPHCAESPGSTVDDLVSLCGKLPLDLSGSMN